MFNFILVALGGGTGAMLRYTVMLGASRYIKSGFPFATLFVNVVGSFVIGVLAFYLIDRFTNPQSWQLFLIVGILGGFTTFSSYSLDVLHLIIDKQIGIALLYAVGSVVLSLFAVYLGMLLVK